MRFEPHSSKQEELIFSDEALTIGATGTQWGKSISASLWMKRQIHSFTAPTDHFLLMAPTYKIMRQSMLPYFLNVMRNYGSYKKADEEFQLHGRGNVYLRTGTDPDSIVGIPNVRAFWLDEAGKATLYFWENIQARAASLGAKGLLTTSPYSLNWIYRDFIKPKLAGLLPELKLIQAASWENPYHSLHDPQKRAQMRAQMDLRRYSMLFGGEWARMSGLVYDCFDEEANLCAPLRLPTGTRYFAGIDWGYSPDPFVCVVRAITPSGQHYQVSEFYKMGQTLSDMVLYAKQIRQVFTIERFYVDPSQPGFIEEFNRSGLPTVGANNDIARGISCHYELIKTRNYQIFQGTSPYTLDEIDTYHYPEPEDLAPDQVQKEPKPVKQNDHCLDANRYVTIETYRTSTKLIPKFPKEFLSPENESTTQRWKRLTRPKRA